MLNDPRVSCLVQEQFGEVRYRVIGDDSAPGFFSVSAESGQVSVSRSVQGDTEIQYRVSDHTSMCAHHHHIHAMQLLPHLYVHAVLMWHITTTCKFEAHQHHIFTCRACLNLVSTIYVYMCTHRLDF